MSAFLGPIHYWLYNKIQLQQAIVDDIYALGEQYALSLGEACDNNFGAFENKPLEEMIDQGNIHGWLQERVSQVEYKYAYAVTTLLNKNQEAKDQMKSILFNNGTGLAKTLKENPLNATEVYKAITDNLLDGMPCDHANRLLEQNENEATWARTICVHSQYWDAASGDISIYYELRDTWIDGLVQELGFTFLKLDEVTYKIIKKA
ncbi:MAG: hypothetical protein ACYDEX_05680 [Mobilitalea sp.]